MRVFVRSFVRSVTGKTLAIEIGSGDTVANLKYKICLEEGILPSLERLMFGGDEMEDHRLVESFGLYSDNCIDLSVRRFPLVSEKRSSFASSAGLLSEQPADQLKGYFFHPISVKPGVKYYSAVRPVHRYKLRFAGVEDRRELQLDKHLPLEASGYHCVDSHLGLLVLQRPSDKELPGFVVWDPVSHEYACLSPPPAEALEQNAAFVLNDSSFEFEVPENIGGVILSRKEGKPLEFEMVYVTVEREGPSNLVKPRAWIASYDGRDCCWNCAPNSGTVYLGMIDGPLYMDRYCVRANGKVFWHLHGSGILNKSILSFDPVRKVFGAGLLPRPANRLGGSSNGTLIAGAVGKQEYLFLRHLRRQRDWKWSPALIVDLSEALDQIPSQSTRNRRVTRMTDFDAGWPQSVLIKTTGNGKFRYQESSSA